MTKREVRGLLDRLLKRKPEPVGEDSPTRADWRRLKEKFHTEFPVEFVSFMEVVASCDFPGELLSARSGEKFNSDADDIAFVYDHEMQYGSWNPVMIPFYSVGNGDYFCLNAKEGKQSAVYYYSHDDGSTEQDCGSFDEWLKKLPEFL